MDTPQEVQVWYILPAIRKKFAVELKKKGKKQKEIASLLNITEAAVSQYLKKKRGKEILLPKNIRSDIEHSSESLIKKKTEFRKEVQAILKKINEERIICKVCQGHTGATEKCEICYQETKVR